MKSEIVALLEEIYSKMQESADPLAAINKLSSDAEGKSRAAHDAANATERTGAAENAHGLACVAHYRAAMAHKKVMTAASELNDKLTKDGDHELAKKARTIAANHANAVSHHDRHTDIHNQQANRQVSNKKKTESTRRWAYNPTLIETAFDSVEEGTPSKRLARMAKGAEAFTAKAEKEKTYDAHKKAFQANDLVQYLARKGKEKRDARGDTEASSDYDKLHQHHSKAASDQDWRSFKSATPADTAKSKADLATYQDNRKKVEKTKDLKYVTGSLSDFNTHKQTAAKASEEAHALTKKVGADEKHPDAMNAHVKAAQAHFHAEQAASALATAHSRHGNPEKEQKALQLMRHHWDQRELHTKQAVSHGAEHWGVTMGMQSDPAIQNRIWKR